MKLPDISPQTAQNPVKPLPALDPPPGFSPDTPTACWGREILAPLKDRSNLGMRKFSYTTMKVRAGLSSAGTFTVTAKTESRVMVTRESGGKWQLEQLFHNLFPWGLVRMFWEWMEVEATHLKKAIALYT